MNITIPEALAREADQAPLRFRPEVALGANVLILGQENPRGGYHVGMTGKVSSSGLSGEIIVTTAVGRARARAWAIIGRCDEDNPDQTMPGDRVLVLRAARISAAVGMIGTVIGGGLGGQILVDFGVDIPDDDGELDRNWVISEWAILPPLADQSSIPEMPDTPGSTANSEGGRRASIAELSNVLTTEIGAEHQPSESTTTLAIRVLREQHALIAEAHKTIRSLTDAAGDKE